MSARDPLPVFAAVGIELEYMIVDATTLDVRSIADLALAALAGHAASAVERGALGWSNELATHVIELKNLAPSPSLEPLADAFQREIAEMDRMLAPLGARLMPTGMHPWMDPRLDTRLWTHDNAEIYRTFDRLFDCRRHGWANLQSMHINLPFAGDGQFRRLHSAIRAVLPLIPALAASSPIADGELKRTLDYRLDVYRSNAERMPSIVGRVVPEPVATRGEYESRVLAPMYGEIAPHDPTGVMRNEWLNSRGAIARFDRSAIEIRVADAQECPRADLAIASAVVALVYSLYVERWSTLDAQAAIATDALVSILDACIEDADRARIDDRAFLALFGLSKPCTARELWAHTIDAVGCAIDAGARKTLSALIEHGPLARRIARTLDGDTSRDRLAEVYGRLCDCLVRGELFATR